MQLWHLIRNVDVSGVSGVGRVAEVVELQNGKVVVGFIVGDVASVIVYDSLDDVRAIHGHGGLSWLEPDVPPISP